MQAQAEQPEWCRAVRDAGRAVMSSAAARTWASGTARRRAVGGGVAPCDPAVTDTGPT
ncbi:hypothetical protein ACGFMO_24685 [Streptomyces niveus]|uniref:hypothetical protein n=1 Tax=Streptomyces niveus TaxID=193462 RepID=UPI00371FF832